MKTTTAAHNTRSSDSGFGTLPCRRVFGLSPHYSARAARRISAFGLRISFGFRPSDFGFQSSFVIVAVLLLASSAARASTNLSTTLQQALFEEEANHNLTAAIQAYQSLITQFDQDRKLAATAVFL